MLSLPTILPLLALATGLLAPAAVSAKLLEGPSGTLQYAKRFQPSGVSSSASCVYVCPSLGYWAWDEDTQEDFRASLPPRSATGEDRLGQTACAYDLPDNGGYQECDFDSTSGVYVGGLSNGGGSGLDCPERASTFDGTTLNSCTVLKRRSLTRLEKIIKARQYRPTYKPKFAK